MWFYVFLRSLMNSGFGLKYLFAIDFIFFSEIISLIEVSDFKIVKKDNEEPGLQIERPICRPGISVKKYFTFSRKF